MAPVVSIAKLKFNYPNHRDILDIPAFEIPRQSHVFLHGPSGSGKSTLLSLMTGILSPREGSIKLFGEDLAQMSSRQRDRFRGDHLGYVFQMFNLLPYLNVMENVTLPLRMSQIKKAQCPSPTDAANELLNDLNIAHLRDKTVTELSIGQQQRVAVARSLIGKPKLIIADEPTSSLDYDSREAFLKLLFKSADKNDSTILFVSHDHSLKNLFDSAVSLQEINTAHQGGAS